MTESMYKEFENKYYNPDDKGKKPGDNENWQSIQEGFYKIGTTDLETSGSLTLGKGTEDEETLTAAELKEMKEGGGGYSIPIFTYSGESSGTSLILNLDSVIYTKSNNIDNYLTAKGHLIGDSLIPTLDFIGGLIAEKLASAGGTLTTAIRYNPDGTKEDVDTIRVTHYLSCDIVYSGITAKAEFYLDINSGYIYLPNDL